jgi:nicotinate-nucleotide pyrophosphorylase
MRLLDGCRSGAAADRVLLDNMTRSRYGSVTFSRAPWRSRCPGRHAGADLLSTSVVTQSAPALDLAFDLRPDATAHEEA